MGTTLTSPKALTANLWTRKIGRKSASAEKTAYLSENQAALGARRRHRRYGTGITREMSSMDLDGGKTTTREWIRIGILSSPCVLYIDRRRDLTMQCERSCAAAAAADGVTNISFLTQRQYRRRSECKLLYHVDISQKR